MFRWLRDRADKIVVEVIAGLIVFAIIAALVAIWAYLEDYSGPAALMFALGALAVLLVIANQARSFTGWPSAAKSVGAEPPSAASRPALPIGTLAMARLNDSFEHCGVLWRGVVQGGQLKAGGPFCTEDRELLKYKTGYRKFKPPKLEPSGQGFGVPPVSASDPLAALLAVPMPPGLKTDDDDEEFEIRDLREDDTSGDTTGPYCTKCKRLRKIPKRVGDCRWEAVQKIEAEQVVLA